MVQRGAAAGKRRGRRPSLTHQGFRGAAKGRLRYPFSLAAGRTTSLSGDSAPYGRAIPPRSPRGPCKRRKGGKRRAAGGRWRFLPADRRDIPHSPRDSAPYGRAIPSRSPRGPGKRWKSGNRLCAAGGRLRFFAVRPLRKRAFDGPAIKKAPQLSLRRHFLFLPFAVSEGFEPPIRSHVHLFSRQAPSTTRTTHQSYPGAKIQKFRQKRKKVKDAPGMGGNLPGEGEPFHAGDYSGRVVPGASLM